MKERLHKVLAHAGVASRRAAERMILDHRIRVNGTLVLERARGLLESGRPLARALPLRLRIELKMVVAGGLRILRGIDAVRGDVFLRRPKLSRRDWAAMSVTALLR